jgi:hydroxypyruvate reductase
LPPPSVVTEFAKGISRESRSTICSRSSGAISTVTALDLVLQFNCNIDDLYIFTAERNVVREVGLRAVARSIFDQTLADCSIERAFMRKVKAASEVNTSARLLFGDHLIDFSPIRHIRVIAAGKAARSMLDALLTRLPKNPQCDLAGVLIAPDTSQLPPDFEFFPGGHPFPNEASFAGARAALAMLNNLPPDASAANTLCLFLISGGASAMMELPLDPSITLDETIAFHRALVHSGASIMEINCVRKHFSAVKGGRFALAARPAACLTILLSDVPPGNPDTIASGPTLPDTSTVAECHRILERYRLLEQFPASICRFFTSDEMTETAKPGELTALTWTMLSADDLAESARVKAESLGFFTVVDNSCDDWNYREAAEYLLGRLRDLRRSQKRVCLISAGEIIVRPKASQSHGIAIVTGNGGRNQHFALFAATLLEEADAPISILSAGSDGIDGHSDAAGAVVDSQTLRDGVGDIAHATDLRASAEKALREFNSSTFLEAVGATIVTGPTGNNLRDLRILLADS